MMTSVPQRHIYGYLFQLLTQKNQTKKPSYKAFDYEDDLKSELSQAREKSKSGKDGPNVA